MSLPLRRCFSASPSTIPRVCIVGSGPAGFYTAKYLLRDHPTLQVDMFDSLPSPFGLVRSGVAPDHQDTKLVMNDFTKVAESERFRFFGNVHVGKDVGLDDLRPKYHKIVLAYGAGSERRLGIPGEDLGNVFSSRAFVNWYNGHPHFVDLPVSLSSTDTAVVVGHGNVSIDIARFLLSPLDRLACTDVPEHALEARRSSTIRRVLVVGRRGPGQASFTTKELREMVHLPGCSAAIDQAEFEAGMTEASREEMGQRAVKRKMDILQSIVTPTEDLVQKREASSKLLELRFLLSPVSIAESATLPGTMGAVTFAQNALSGPAGQQSAQPIPGSFLEEQGGLLVSSIGYKCEPLSGVPFDSRRNVIPSTSGRVDGDAQVYVTGWLKRGPRGIIGTNVPDAAETSRSLLADLSSASLTEVGDVLPILSHCQLFSWDAWKRANEREIEKGVALGKKREKFIRVQDFFDAAE